MSPQRVALSFLHGFRYIASAESTQRLAIPLLGLSLGFVCPPKGDFREVEWRFYS